MSSRIPLTAIHHVAASKIGEAQHNGVHVRVLYAVRVQDTQDACKDGDPGAEREDQQANDETPEMEFATVPQRSLRRQPPLRLPQSVEEKAWSPGSTST